ncbi:MAG: sodium:calcium antiporter [Dehalococcoidia bacterium]
MEALVFGAGVVAAAFLLSWAAEVAESEVSAALALAGVALIAVLPEYAVDLYFAWQAGQEAAAGIPPERMQYVHYATANMTGANRLLVGLAWPLVGLLWWLRTRGHVRLERGVSLELLAMLLATLFAFTIPIKGSIAWWDGLVLVGLFALYIYLTSRLPQREPELVGPPMAIASLPKPWRRATIVALFLFSAGMILSSAEPFAEGLLGVGRKLGVSEFIMVQWIAPLASETPEVLVAGLLTIRGDAVAGMMVLISSKVNQWTLLVGTLPFAYSISAGSLLALPLDARQAEEIWLTAAQSLLAVVVLVRLNLPSWGAFLLLVLWATQLGFTSTAARFAYVFLYLGASTILMLAEPARLRDAARLPSWAIKTVREPERAAEPVGGAHSSPADPPK